MYLHFFHDDNSDFTKHLQDKMDIVQWISRFKKKIFSEEKAVFVQGEEMYLVIFCPSHPHFLHQTDEAIGHCPLVALANPTNRVK